MARGSTQISMTMPPNSRSSEREPADSLRDKSNFIGGWLPLLTSLAPMFRLLQCLVFALVLSTAGCSNKPDPVLGSFVNDEFSTNRIVRYASGKYELYGANDHGSLQKHPYVTGTFVGGVSNYVVSYKKGVFDSPDMPAWRVYRIIKNDGVEYLFDERGNAVRKFEETKDERELRHAWRREGG